MIEPRVLFVCHGHPRIVAGGTEIAAHDLFRAWRGAGREALFLACVSRLHRDAHGNAAFQTIGRSSHEMLLRVGGYDRFMVAQNDAAEFAASFGELLADFRPDVIHFHHFSLVGLEALAVARRTAPRAALVATLHDYDLICANGGLMTTTGGGALCRAASADACRACFPEIGLQRFATRRLHLRNMLGLVDAFIAPSRFLKGRFVAWGLPATGIHVVPNAVPPLERATPPGRPEADGRHRRFAFFGNLAPHKGALLAIEAMGRLADLPHAELRLHGADIYRDPAFSAELERRLREAGSNVTRLGAYDRDDLARLMAACDWVVVPSTWWENAPLVILEAYRHGRPVIAADFGGMAELVENEVSGLSFRAGDAADLARVMRRAASEHGLWERLRAQLPTPPTPADSVDRHLALYRALLGQDEAQSA